MIGVDQPQLLLQVQGRGGTGKSLLIQAITELFEYYQCAGILSKAATSGIAGSQIGGSTVHSWAGIAVGNTGPVSDEIHERRQRNLALKDYAIIDESSMLDKTLLCKVSDAAAEARSRNGNGDPQLPFGGLNVLLFGDFHQFPPVGNSTGALYEPSKSTDKPLTVRGKDIYDQFDKVVILQKQMRCQDQPWDDLLGRLREGMCTDDDIDEVKKLVLSDPRCDVPDFSSQPWDQAILITSRHAVRKEWNKRAVEKHCHQTNVVKFVVQAHDIDTRTKARPDNLVRLQLAKKANSDMSRKLEERIDMAVGMQAMVMTNIATEADLANGTRGTIEDIILDPREPDLVVENGVAVLQFLPVAILLKPRTPSKLTFPGITPGLIPVTPSSSFLGVKPEKRTGKKSRVKRTQFAITPAYAFTDYKAQGQTIERVLIDIAKPPTGTMSPFAVYVALSRSRGRNTIRLLRGFDETAFRSHPSEALRLEMLRLTHIDATLKREQDLKKMGVLHSIHVDNID